MVETLPSNAVGVGSVPAQGTKVPRASWPENQNKNQKQYCNKFKKKSYNKKHTQFKPVLDLEDIWLSDQIALEFVNTAS